MRSPAGTVEGLCTASATIFAVGIAFLGYRGLLEPTPWRPLGVLVVLAVLGGFGALGLLPSIATAPAADDREAKLVLARCAFLAGVAGIWLAVAISVLGSPAE